MIEFNREYFNIFDTLDCGQLFRFKPFRDGFIVYSLNHACYLHYDGDKVKIESDDDKYFFDYFDLQNDYSLIFQKALSFNILPITEAATKGKGIRILKQDKIETIFSFVTSQNNNIPRIKRIIEGLCEKYGEKKQFLGENYFAFPSIEVLSKISVEEFMKMGLGYRASYFFSISKTLLENDFLNKLNVESGDELEKTLLSLKGVGPKVCDCIMLFGFSQTNRFPVDTWIEKIYHEDFKGELTDRKKITSFFTEQFGEYSGFIQQYLFFAKRLDALKTQANS